MCRSDPTSETIVTRARTIIDEGNSVVIYVQRHTLDYVYDKHTELPIRIIGDAPDLFESGHGDWQHRDQRLFLKAIEPFDEIEIL